MVLGKTTSIVDGQKAKEALGTNTSEMSGNLVSESPLQGSAEGLSFLSHEQQKGSVGAGPSEEAMKEESHQNDSTSSAAQSLGNWEHIPEACDAKARSQTPRKNCLFTFYFSELSSQS